MEAAPVSGGQACPLPYFKFELATWEALQDIAYREGCSVRCLMAEIDRNRIEVNFGAAVRGCVVRYYRAVLQEVLADVRIAR
jgi:predicted DNA-binding ribbon-helix-helix protein